MTLTINLPDAQTEALAAKARARGLSAEEYARQVLENDLVPEWLQKSWESAKQAGTGSAFHGRDRRGNCRGTKGAA